MSELFVAFRQHLVWALMLWVLVFAAFTALFANGRLIAFAAGIGRVLASIVTTPFRFIRRAVAAVLAHTPEAEEQYRASDQYLLNKGMLVLQAIVIVCAVGALSAAVLVTWDVLVSPSEVRRAAREYGREFEAQQKKSNQAAAALATLDSEWAPKQEAAVAAYRKTRQTTIATTQKDMLGIETSVRSYGGSNVSSTLQRLEQLVAQRSADSYDEIARTKRYLDSTVSNNWYWIGDWRGTLNRWNELWQQKDFAQFELATLSIDNLRAAEQAAYPQAKATNDAERETLQQMEPVLAAHREAASLKWKAAFFRALGATVTFLLFVWLAGAFIEGGWMAIRVAHDVRRIRAAAVPAATVEAAQALEPRIALRDVAAHARAEPLHPI